MKFSKLVVILVVLIVLVGSAAFLYAFMKVGSEPSVLIGFFYGFFATELFNLTRIKVAESRKNTTKKHAGGIKRIAKVSPINSTITNNNEEQ